MCVPAEKVNNTPDTNKKGDVSSTVATATPYGQTGGGSVSPLGIFGLRLDRPEARKVNDLKNPFLYSPGVR